MYPNTPYVERVHAAMTALAIDIDEMNVWSSAVKASLLRAREETAAVSERDPTTADLLKTQSTLIRELVEQNQRLARLNTMAHAKLDRLEQIITHQSSETPIIPSASLHTRPQLPAAAEPARKRYQTKKSLRNVWYEWFAEKQRAAPLSRQRLHDLRACVCFMRLFLPGGYDLVSGDLLQIASDSETNVPTFLQENGESASAVGIVVVRTKRFNRAGALNDKIRSYQVLMESGRIIDNSPPASRFKVFMN
ncbi:hypothetical protein PybrP1_005522 [[Pythium] brassicae (nom. inval.)]|nr:hypothetical protein PybrP1_005522 [[Pythium] brassicae (nom. inval.)]